VVFLNQNNPRLFIYALDTSPGNRAEEKISIKSSAIEIFSPRELDYHLAWCLSTIFGRFRAAKSAAISKQLGQKQYVANKQVVLHHI